MKNENRLIHNAKFKLHNLFLAGKITKNDELKICLEIDALIQNREPLNLVNTILNTPDDILINIITKK
jgi:hypothetical protein